ncbi:MAG: hypothetical protein K2I92_06510 [Muribaculaceae bacterium]|nr:hypothetical protein [Muribaculaceae bacterium]
MAKKSAISGEYIITEEDSGSIRVCQIYDNVMESLRQCAKEVGFSFDSKWNTQQLGKALVDEYGDGKIAEIGEYTISRDGSGHIDSYRVFGNTIAVLRKIAGEVGMKYHSDWNTRQLGNKLIDFVNGDTDSEVVEETGFLISPDMTTHELWNAFRDEFGTVIRIKKGVKRCDPSLPGVTPRDTLAEMPLSDAGLKASFTINGDMTVEEAESLAASNGLKVQIATVDDWTTCLPQTPLDSAKFMPKKTTKAKMQEILDR